MCKVFPVPAKTINESKAKLGAWNVSLRIALKDGNLTSNAAKSETTPMCAGNGSFTFLRFFCNRGDTWDNCTGCKIPGTKIHDHNVSTTNVDQEQSQRHQSRVCAIFTCLEEFGTKTHQELVVRRQG